MSHTYEAIVCKALERCTRLRASSVVQRVVVLWNTAIRLKTAQGSSRVLLQISYWVENVPAAQSRCAEYIYIYISVPVLWVSVISQCIHIVQIQ